MSYANLPGRLEDSFDRATLNSRKHGQIYAMNYFLGFTARTTCTDDKNAGFVLNFAAVRFRHTAEKGLTTAKNKPGIKATGHR